MSDPNKSLAEKLREPWADLEREHPRTVHALWRWSPVVLLALALADLGVHHHEHFGVDGVPGFYSVYGFVTCVAMVLGAKLIVGAILKRKDTYYDGD
ncbi:MAG: hypothetical protein KC636_33535 [Myxococcales bacterium]|nr:hypothetical protein [Myxococcales bacterium]